MQYVLQERSQDMKKQRLKVTASAIIAGLYAAGCTFEPADNEPVDIYGPPPVSDVTEDPEETEYPEIEESEDPEETEAADPETEEEDGSFRPGENTAQPLYGPPAGDVHK